MHYREAILNIYDFIFQINFTILFFFIKHIRTYTSKKQQVISQINQTMLIDLKKNGILKILN